MPTHSTSSRRILLTGATGYVGGRLLSLLEASGEQLRCLTRRPESLRGVVAASTEIAKADLLDAESVGDALEGIDTAYYLVHSMGASGDFEQEDRLAAQNFANAASAAGVRRIVYLGGLGDDSEELSKHLRSRHETGNILRQSTTQVIEFRASIVLGSGSLSFELIRALVNRLPAMICPRWVRTPAQPIAIEDLLDYLLQALDVGVEGSPIFEIGGPDQVSYGEIMQEYARQRGLKRLMIPVPVLTPRISSLWLGLVTPVYARIGKKLIESMRNPTLVTDERALEVFAVKPRGLSEAIARALVNEDSEFALTRWSDALSSGGPETDWGGTRFGSRIVDSRTVRVGVPTGQAFEPIRQIGGRRGWYYGTWLWQIRGFLDLMVGGIGVRRGRRHPDQLRVGDALDFWRVERYEPGRLLLLQAEMKVPGRAWLEFEVEPASESSGGGSVIRQTAQFDPLGLFGLAYWYGLYPLHFFVFRGMLRNIARAAERGQKECPA